MPTAKPDSIKPDLISVVLSTYNQPAWLEKVLWGYSVQQHRRFEIVLADDGSRVTTSEMVKRLRDQTGMTIKHVWHADDGFRKSTILNRALEAVAGSYVLFSDGDCIPRSDFVAQHYAALEPERFLSGGYYKLPMELSQRITADDIRSGRAFSLGWLRRNGLPPSHRWLRLVSGRASTLLNRITPTRPTWNGNNSSGWTADVIAAGGYDERMRYGGQDRELGERLENAGVRGKHVRFQTVVLHLDHGRGYANEEDLNRNLSIRRETVSTGRQRTSHGLSSKAA
ncbi:putative glycosyl transferase [Rubripirellula tenax]|uniref:Putative glycosyl transferase n=1 Tax=Rubripirellula tenax TaxID=2528015 RepID=A0A5C6FFK5_9BACT|nr:glycosyltransferase [Rubripirellula tenax]TWU60291.1 putative glycosyl transferase [Rubripirellula tenax]